MSAIEHDGLLDLIDTWASLLGYYSGRIDLKSGTLSDCTTPDCTLTAHAPLWGTRKGKEVAVPVAEVRKRLSGMLRWVRIQRHSMHLALHPEQHAASLFFEVKARTPLLPITLGTVPLAFVVTAEETGTGLHIKHIHEWPAGTPEEAQRVLVERCGWPETTTFQPHVAFGAVS